MIALLTTIDYRQNGHYHLIQDLNIRNVLRLPVFRNFVLRDSDRTVYIHVPIP